jgi:hypothetical protein
VIGCHIIVLNVHAPTEDETDEVKDSFYEGLECWNVLSLRLTFPMKSSEMKNI